MGWSGGTFTRVHDWTEDEAGGYDILSTRMDEEDDNFESGINACLHKAGQNAPTANLPMGGFVHTGVGTSTSLTSYPSTKQVQNSAFIYGGTTGGSINAYTITVSPAPTAYTAGQLFTFKADRTNGGATTLNVNSLGAKNVYNNGAACAGSEIVVGRMYTVIYDGTQFHLVSGAGGSGSSYGGAKICMTSEYEVAADDEKIVPFITEIYDDSNYHNPSYPTQFTIPVTGRYRVSYGIFWKGISDSFGNAYASSYLLVNASPRLGSAVYSYVGWDYYLNMSPNLNYTYDGLFTAGDVLKVVVRHSNASDGPRSVYGDGTEATSTWFAIERIY